MENMERNSSVKSKSDAVLLCLFGENFQDAIEVFNYQKFKERIKIIERIFIFRKNFLIFYKRLFFIFYFFLLIKEEKYYKYFNFLLGHLPEEQIKQLASKLRRKIYKNIIKDEGEFFDRIYFIVKGKVDCIQNFQNHSIKNNKNKQSQSENQKEKEKEEYPNNNPPFPINPLISNEFQFENSEIKNSFLENQYFGEVGLFIDFMTNWRYQAIGEVVVYELDNYQVPEILGKDYLNIIMENLFKKSITECSNLKGYLTKESILALYNIFRLEFYFSNKIVFRKEMQFNKKISIIISGKLINENQNENERYICIAKTEDIFGEEIIDNKEK